MAIFEWSSSLRVCRKLKRVGQRASLPDMLCGLRRGLRCCEPEGPRLLFRLLMGNRAGYGRFSRTLSTMPYSLAWLASMKKSRSVSRIILSRG